MSAAGFVFSRYSDRCTPATAGAICRPKSRCRGIGSSFFQPTTGVEPKKTASTMNANGNAGAAQRTMRDDRVSFRRPRARSGGCRRRTERGTRHRTRTKPPRDRCPYCASLLVDCDHLQPVRQRSLSICLCLVCGEGHGREGAKRFFPNLAFFAGPNVPPLGQQLH